MFPFFAGPAEGGPGGLVYRPRFFPAFDAAAHNTVPHHESHVVDGGVPGQWECVDSLDFFVGANDYAGIGDPSVLYDQADNEVGEVTSGTMSPSLNKGIGLGYVKTAFAAPDTTLLVKIRKNLVPATVITI